MVVFQFELCPSCLVLRILGVFHFCSPGAMTFLSKPVVLVFTFTRFTPRIPSRPDSFLVGPGTLPGVLTVDSGFPSFWSTLDSSYPYGRFLPRGYRSGVDGRTVTPGTSNVVIGPKGPSRFTGVSDLSSGRSSGRDNTTSTVGRTEPPTWSI